MNIWKGLELGKGRENVVIKVQSQNEIKEMLTFMLILKYTKCYISIINITLVLPLFLLSKEIKAQKIKQYSKFMLHI